MATCLMKLVFLLTIICGLFVPAQTRLVNMKAAKARTACSKSLRAGRHATLVRPSHRGEENSEVDEHELILKVFRQFDADGSGSISGLELKKALESVGIKVSAVQADDYIQQYDQNDSDSIEFDEFDELYHDLLANN